MATVTCPVAVLAPGSSTSCTASYVITQSDLDAGSVTNHATAAGSPPGDQAQVTAGDSVTVPPIQDIDIRLDKRGSGPVPIATGDSVNYEFLVDNTGNVSLTGIEITDPLPGLSPVSCPGTSLAPGEQMTCSASYLATSADIVAGMIENTATVTGRTNSGRVASDPSSTVTSTARVSSTIETIPTLSKTALLICILLLPVAGGAVLRRAGSPS